MLVSSGALFYSNHAWAQEPAVDAGNRVNLSATATVEAPQDWMTLSLGTTREGAEALAVQTQLKAALDAALALAKPAVVAGGMELRTGNFSLHPRFGRDGKSTGWQGSVELTLEGKDFERITTTAGKVQTLTLNGVSFGLSSAARAGLEASLQAQAIDRFKAKAQAVATAFGFGGYQLMQVSVGAVDNAGGPRPMMAMSVARGAMADAPVPAEAGRAQVQLTVNGAVRLK